MDGHSNPASATFWVASVVPTSNATVFLTLNIELRSMPNNNLAWCQWLLELQLGWVRAAETRLSFILPASTAMMGLLASKLQWAGDDTWYLGCTWTSRLSCLTLAVLLYSLFCVWRGMRPQTRGPKGSKIFFGGIAELDASEFTAEAEADVASAALKDLLSQIHRNAEIAVHKYLWMKRAMDALLIGTPLWIVSYALSAR